MKKPRPKKAYTFSCLLCLGIAVGAQSFEPIRPAAETSRLDIGPSLEFLFPRLPTMPGRPDGDAVIDWSIGSFLQASYFLNPNIFLLAKAGFHNLLTANRPDLLYIGAAGGLGFGFSPWHRIRLQANVYAGLGKIPDTGITTEGSQSYGLYQAGGRFETSFRLTSALRIGLTFGYERLATPALSFVDALSASLSLNLIPAELKPDISRLSLEKIRTENIFPILRAWYNDQALGSVTIYNGEAGPVHNLRVYFYTPEYMGNPRLCTVIPKLEKGESITVPLYAIFDERILNLTQNTTTVAEVKTEYTFLGSRRTASENLSLNIHHRNAMSWEDDRRAAAFVSPTDPAALWFSRYASSLVRDRLRQDLPPNLQQALGIFEALRLFGVNYVIDPNSAYVDMAANSVAVDYLQYPSETLMYRGGDCDDLSILYCSLLESAGIATAFITIPGHIYMAFDLGISEAQAREQFFDPALLFYKNGTVWVPVEITMVREGFVKAWRIGAKQWLDNVQAGSADLYPMRDNWKQYQASGIQDAAARFVLPDESEAMQAFDLAVNRFILRELGPAMQEYETRLARAPDNTTLNEYGILLARAGLLDDAWKRFSSAADAGYAWAWNNLASIAFARKDYELAYSYFEWAESLQPDDPLALLGLARSAYELDRYGEAELFYRRLKQSGPLLANRFGYLASVYGGSGRAWSLADRLSSTVWSRPGLSFADPDSKPETTPADAAPSLALTVPPPRDQQAVNLSVDKPETLVPAQTAAIAVPETTAPLEQLNAFAAVSNDGISEAVIIAESTPIESDQQMSADSEIMLAASLARETPDLNAEPETLPVLSSPPEEAAVLETSTVESIDTEVARREPPIVAVQEPVATPAAPSVAVAPSAPETAAAQPVAPAPLATTAAQPAIPSPAATAQPAIPSPAAPTRTDPAAPKNQPPSAPPKITTVAPLDQELGNRNGQVAQTAEPAQPAAMTSLSAPATTATVPPTLPPASAPTIIAAAPRDTELRVQTPAPAASSLAPAPSAVPMSETGPQQVTLPQPAAVLTPAPVTVPTPIAIQVPAPTPVPVPTPEPASDPVPVPAPTQVIVPAIVEAPAPAQSSVPTASDMPPPIAADSIAADSIIATEPAVATVVPLIENQVEQSRPAASPELTPPTPLSVPNPVAAVETPTVAVTEKAEPTPETTILTAEETPAPQPVQTRAVAAAAPATLKPNLEQAIQANPIFDRPDFSRLATRELNAIQPPYRPNYVQPTTEADSHPGPAMDLPAPLLAETAEIESKIEHDISSDITDHISISDTTDQAAITQIAKEPETADSSSIFQVDFTQAGIRSGSGQWTLETSQAINTDGDAMYAKLVVPAPNLSGPTAYEFTAESRGWDWVGFGLHIHGRGDWKLSYYGGGASLLVWITSDPRRYGDPAPRLQLYQSYDEVKMILLESIKIPGSVYEARHYRIEYDPELGTIKISVDGIQSLTRTGLQNPAEFDYTALRAIDKAIFSNYQIYSLPPTGTLPEKDHE